MEIELRFAREILRLRGAELLEPEIDAGQPARIRADARSVFAARARSA